MLNNLRWKYIFFFFLIFFKDIFFPGLKGELKAALQLSFQSKGDTMHKQKVKFRAIVINAYTQKAVCISLFKKYVF